MARAGASKRRRRGREELPPPLPPERRTVGQLVAESVRLYGRRFWPSLALGIGPAAVTLAAYEVGLRAALSIVVAAYLVCMTGSYMAASLLVSGQSISKRSAANGFAVGVPILLPTLVLGFGFGLPALAWLAFFGLAVPAAMVEQLSPVPAVKRGLALGRADYAHALGSLCALWLVVILTQILLFSLLYGASHQGAAIAGLLASLVISPVLFLGAALLYYDQDARLRLRSPATTTRRRDAHVSDALDAD